MRVVAGDVRHQSGMAQNQPTVPEACKSRGCHAPRMPTARSNMSTNAASDRPIKCAISQAWRKTSLTSRGSKVARGAMRRACRRWARTCGRMRHWIVRADAPRFEHGVETTWAVTPMSLSLTPSSAHGTDHANRTTRIGSTRHATCNAWRDFAHVLAHVHDACARREPLMARGRCKTFTRLRSTSAERPRGICNGIDGSDRPS